MSWFKSLFSKSEQETALTPEQTAILQKVTNRLRSKDGYWLGLMENSKEINVPGYSRQFVGADLANLKVQKLNFGFFKSSAHVTHWALFDSANNQIRVGALNGLTHIQTHVNVHVNFDWVIYK